MTINDDRMKQFKGGRREAILNIAREVFSQEGYGAASMSHIAARLGGSKATLYAYFRSKEELFRADIQDRCSTYAHLIFDSWEAEGDIRTVLTSLADRILRCALTDESITFYNLVVSEAQRNPAIGHAFFESGPKIALERITAALEKAHVNEKLRTSNCLGAAEDFLSLIHGGLHFKRTLHIRQALSVAEIEAEASRIVDVFLRAYGS